MKKVLVALTIVALLGLVAFADTNPWEDDGDTVAFEVVIPNITEVWSTIGSGQARSSALDVELEITNAGGVIPASGKAHDTISHLSNVPVKVFVTLVGNIPAWSRFHVIVGITNENDYDSVATWAGRTQPAADKIITWDRRATAYTGNQPSIEIEAFTGLATTASIQHKVDYAVDAINGLPPLGDASVEIIWTIASNI